MMRARDLTDIDSGRTNILVAKSALANRRQVGAFQFDCCNIYYLTAYLNAVIGNINKRGVLIYAVELTTTPQALSCSIILEPPPQPIGLAASVWAAYRASWDERRGWCCHIRHLINDQAEVHRYLGDPLVPAPEVVADFIAGLSRALTFKTLGPARAATRCHYSSRELADHLTHFIPTCVWIG
jgi:hypothetical protein